MGLCSFKETLLYSTGIQAVTLKAKLKYLDHWNSHRASIAAHYLSDFAEFPIQQPAILSSCHPKGSLPIGPKLDGESVKQVIQAVKAAVAND
jgi:dTDP-4-amino-4,6-dideoxygalactose transaminase